MMFSQHPCAHSFKHTHGSRPPLRPGATRTHRKLTTSCSATANKPSLQSDVVVLGAGVIGLSTSVQLLQRGASVLLVEQGQTLCSGATGAGQGYVWMCHRSPNTAGWDLARASKEMLQRSSKGFAESIELQATGSMLLSRTADETHSLQERQELLARNGVPARLLDSDTVCKMEPALILPKEGAGLLVDSDLQVNGRKMASSLLEACQAHGDRFQHLFGEPVQRLHLEQQPPLAETAEHVLKGRLATIVAAGAWSGELLSAATGEGGYRRLLKPRKGHLLEMDRPPGMPRLSGPGMMEMSYTKHYAAQHSAPASTANAQPESSISSSSSSSSSKPNTADITFTATTSVHGSLLIGSSREFVSLGPDSSHASSAVVDAILKRAQEYLPDLAAASFQPEAVRVGLRPFAVGGYPMIGGVPGCPGLFVAAGHEGSGLTLSPATAHLMASHVLGQPVDHLHPDTVAEVQPSTRLLMADL